MNQQVTTAIVLARTDYGEADRILTLLTPDHGKLRLLAKGVRRVKSKLAGGIELFSISTIIFVRGRGDIGTLVSTRLVKHYGNIVADIDRTMLGYEFIKTLNQVTEDQVEGEYFELLGQAFGALNDDAIWLPLIRLWFYAQLLKLGGHTPNLHTDSKGKTLQEGQTYRFNFDSMCFEADHGEYTAQHIKFLRLVFSGYAPQKLAQVQNLQGLISVCTPLLERIRHL
jgi:DNA repair protein RecO (recombination protein O)